VLAGTTKVRGSLAFFGQSPFILNATVKANILFSHVNDPVDEERYQRAISCCALEHDLGLLPAGDQTEIGEKGITLSGGQKARVALARAVYHGADISLIDDALSAVDAHVAQHLFKECIVKELMQGKSLATSKDHESKRSVILATNALQHLSHPRVDRIVVLREGRIVEQGSYKELSRNPNSEFSRFLAVIDKTGVTPSCLPEMGGGGDETEISRDTHKKEGAGMEISSQARSKRVSGTIADVSGTIKKNDTTASRLMTEEERSTGHVGTDVYFSWARAAGGVWIPFVVVIAFGAVECISVGSKWYITYWSQHGNEGSQMHFLLMYALINLSSLLASFCRLVMIMMFGLRASRRVSSFDGFNKCHIAFIAFAHCYLLQ
jgi:ATP-binding cassette subfamily C (CFTR/MRP) protein 1